MYSPFPLILLALSLLLCCTIIILSAHDGLGDFNQQPKLKSDDDYMVEHALQDNNGSTIHLSQGDGSSAMGSDQHIVSASEKFHDDSLERLLPKEILLSLHEPGINLSIEQMNETEHDESANSIKSKLDPTYSNINIDRETYGETTEPLLNATSDEPDNESNVINNEDVTSGKVHSYNPQPPEENLPGSEKIMDLGEEDETDSQKAPVFVDYASKYSGANIIDKSKDFQGTSNLLVDDDDRYAISPCDIGNGGTKYVIIALSEDILVKTIKISSYERYSSQTKQFQVLGSQTYPISTKWVDLGTFTAKPWYSTNGHQTFELEHGVWARYLKFRFLSHYGNEHYCTITQIMVHGQTTLQDFHEARWDTAEEFVAESEDAAVSMNGNLGAAETNVTSETSSVSDGADNVNATHTTMLHDNEEPESIKSTFTNLPESNDTDRGASDVSNEATQNSAISLSVPSAKRHDRDSRYTADFYQNILQMSSKSFQTIYNAADNQCIDARALLATSTKSHTFETTFRNVANFSTRLESTTPSIVSTLSSNKSKVYEAVNSAVMSVVKISPISDALKGIQRFLHVDLSQDSMTPRKRVTQPVFDHVTNATIQNEGDGSFNQTILDSDRVESDKLYTTTNESIDDKEPLSPIELKYESRERNARLKVAECLGRLSIQELKIKAGKAGVKGGGAASTVNEPIFKKLADEIKALQTNQGVYDQFIKSATACYQSVITEMMNDMLVLESNMEQRFIEIERNLLRRTVPHSDPLSWLDLLMHILRSLKVYLWKQLSAFYSFRLSTYEETKGRMRLWGDRSLQLQMNIKQYLRSYSKATFGFHFDTISFLSGFIFAFLIMFMFIWRKNTRLRFPRVATVLIAP